MPLLWALLLLLVLCGRSSDGLSLATPTKKHEAVTPDAPSATKKKPEAATTIATKKPKEVPSIASIPKKPENPAGPALPIPASIASLDPTIAIPEQFLNFAEDYFAANGQKEKGPRSNWVDKFEPDPESTCTTRRPFSLLSWNILAQSLYTKPPVIAWKTRLTWILSTLKQANADIIALQEVQDDEVFYQDLLPALQELGYDGVVQGATQGVREIKRRKGKGDRAHRVATFWKRDQLEEAFQIPPNANAPKKKNKDDNYVAHMARGRTLTSLLQTKETDSEAPIAVLAVVNCHLEGHPNQYAARIRQLQHSLDDLATRVEDPQNAYNGLVIAGDFNCELDSSACSTYLKIGRVGRKGGLGGVFGTAAFSVPPSILESEEAAQVLSPILEWGQVLCNNEMESVKPHPFRRNSLVSAYPPQLDANVHFTYCARPFRPVSGLDQIWYSSSSLKRIALRRAISSPTARNIILQTGLPEEMLAQPSDHLPVGALFEWNTCDPDQECDLTRPNKNKCSEAGVRELVIVQDQPPPAPKPISPIMAYAELDLLMSACPFDNDAQRETLETILDSSLPQNKDKKPSDEEIQKLRELSDQKKLLLQQASEQVRPTLQRILKLKKEVAKYEEEMGFA